MLNDEILHKWVNGKLKAEELEEFKSRPEYETLVALYKNTKDLSAPDFDEEAMLTDILNVKKEAVPNTSKGKRRFLSTWVKLAVAASVLLLATWVFWPKNNEIVFKLAKGEKTEAFLPDESTFVLNAESTLRYDPKTWNTDRTLMLKGEAFFDVKKGSTFKVKTRNGVVQVLGTKFNVWSRNGSLEVKCQSGKVAILSTEGQVLDELLQNDAIRIAEGEITEKWQFQATERADWVEGISKFKKVKLEVVLKELERQFDIRIKPNTVNTQEIISCNFQHEDLEMALKTTLTPLDIQYEIQEGKVVVLSE